MDDKVRALLDEMRRITENISRQIDDLRVILDEPRNEVSKKCRGSVLSNS